MKTKKSATKGTKSTKLLCLLCLLWLTPQLQAQTLEQVFAKMDEVAKAFRSTEANIERTHVTVLVNDKDVASGKFYYVRQGKEPRLKIELTKPALQMLLVDKGKLQLYTPSLKQVQVAPLGEHSNAVEQVLALAFGQSSQELKKNYDITLGKEEVLEGKKTAVLNLKPRNTKMFTAIQMWMDQQRWIAVQFRVQETGGDYGIYKFSNIKMNGGISDSTFDLKMPKDVHVIKL